MNPNSKQKQEIQRGSTQGQQVTPGHSEYNVCY